MLVQSTQTLLTDDHEFFKKTSITFVSNVAIRSALLNDSPLDGKRFVVVFECPGETKNSLK